MKRIVFSLVLAICLIWNVQMCALAAEVGSVEINESVFPDSRFREIISERYDTNHDDVLSVEEIRTVTELQTYDWVPLSERPKSIKGVEKFIYLKKLDCDRCPISNLDLSTNTELVELDCSLCNLKRLDLSKNKKLRVLNCECNDLTEIIVAKGGDIETIDCTENELINIDFSDCPKLKSLDCNYNDIDRVNVRNCPQLSNLQYGAVQSTDPRVIDLDISGCTSLERLTSSYMYYTSLNAANCTSLKELNLNSPCLSSVVADNCTSLEKFVIHGFWTSEAYRERTEMKVSLKGCTKLKEVSCSGEVLLKALDLGGLESLESVSCRCSGVTNLDLAGCRKLKTVDCHYSRLTSLDLSDCVSLEELNCSNNNIQQLDVSPCPSLRKLIAWGTQITILDLRKNKILSDLVGKEDEDHCKYVDCASARIIRYGEDIHVTVSRWKNQRGKLVAIDNRGGLVGETGIVKWGNYYILVLKGAYYARTTFFRDPYDGKWKYFVNGIQVRGGDTFVYQYGKYLRVTNGELNRNNGFVRYNGQYVFSYNGSAATFYTGWIRYSGYKCYLQRGVLKRYTR